jgi:hypothetical protein
MKKKYKIILIVVFIVIVVLVIAAFLLGFAGRVIAKKNNMALIYKEGNYPFEFINISECLKPTLYTNITCGLLGGEFKIEAYDIGFGSRYKIGCFPKGTTADAGQSCSADTKCEGECIWLNGDVIQEGDTATCSSYRLPFYFYYGGGTTCDELLNSENYPYRPALLDHFVTNKSEDYYNRQYQDKIKKTTQKYWQNGDFSKITEQLAQMRVPLEYHLMQKDFYNDFSVLENNSEKQTDEARKNAIDDLNRYYEKFIKKW